MNLLLAYVGKHKKLLILALVMAAINQFFSLLDPFIFRLIIDNFASRAEELAAADFIKGTALLLLASMGVAFVSRTAKAFQDFYSQTLKQRVGTEMYADAVAHSFSLPYEVFEDQRSGEHLGKLERARTDSQKFILSAINTLFISAIGIIFVLVYAAFAHWLLGLVFFLIIPSLGLVTFFLSKKIKEIQQRIVRETNALAGSTTETLRNVELVKSLGLEDQEIRRLNETNEKILTLELRKVVLLRKLDYIQGTTINALRSALMLLMFWFIYTGAITIGEFFSLMFYSFFIFAPLAQFGMVASDYQEAKVSNEELEKVLALKSEENQKNLQTLGPIESIRYDNLNFAYASGGGDTLKNISLEIHSGETVAFVGPSGAGKSTIVKLLAGLYRPTSGKLLINGVDTMTANYENLRMRIGLVAQETQLFAGTIRENLLFVKPGATDEECLEAIRHASAQNILERTSEGLDTKIGEGGVKISGGERQRLAIARALLRNPEILIFDEATSSLDSITEKSIIETMHEIVHARPKLITILIAHRLSTVVHADRIYVLRKGEIVESGIHADLRERDGLYKALWKEQTAASGTSQQS